MDADCFGRLHFFHLVEPMESLDIARHAVPLVAGFSRRIACGHEYVILSRTGTFADEPGCGH